jgi:tetratricopeptide (TPR) repeat protein
VKYAAIILCLLAPGVPAAVPAQVPVPPSVSAHDLFERGNQLYEAGEFEDAVTVYGEAVSLGVLSADLYYNLGNAYYKSGALGRAVLNYERALRLAPRDDDIRTNLGLVQSLLRDKQFVQDPGFVKRVVTWLHNRINLREALYLASLLYLALVLVTITFIFRETRFVSRLYPGISILSPGRIMGLDKTQDFVLAMATLFILLSASGVSAMAKYRLENSRRAAVVVVEEAAVFGRPDSDATLQFKVHEGTRIITGETRPGWIQIHLPGDLEGWVPNRSLERI